MTPKTDLFELIRSLNKNEKGYFKRFCARQEGEKKYLLLFDFISQQNEYNESEILTVFKKEKFVKNFSVAKAYLYDTILESLHNYHADISAEATLDRMFHYIEILFQKGLYKQCEELIKKIVKIATTYEKDFHILQSYHWTLKISNSLGFKKTDAAQLRSIFDNMEIALDRLSQTVKYSNLGTELTFIIGKEGEFTYDGVGKKIESIIAKASKGNNTKNDSVRLQIFKRMIFLYHSFYIKKDIEESFESIQECIRLFESKKELISDKLLTYITIHANMLVISSRKKNEKAFFTSLNKLREIDNLYQDKLSPKQRASIFEHSYISELSHYINSASFEKIESVVDAIVEGIERHKNSSNEINRNILVVNVGIMLYGNNQPKAALKWFLKLINQEDFKTRPDIVAVAKMLIVIIHYELDNFDILTSLIRSTNRFLKEHKLLSKVEIEVLKYITTALKNYDKKEKAETQKLIIETKNELSLIDLGEFSSYFNYNAWLTAQLENKTYAEVLKRIVKN
jgi:hypothetical protein